MRTIDHASPPMPARAWHRHEDAAQRPICTFFAMGGCSKGGRCPFSHELVQVAPKGVDVSGGFFISGNVANYKSAASVTAALPSSHSFGGRCDDPTASSSADGLSTLASPSSGYVTTGTSLSVDTKELGGGDSAGASSLGNSEATSTSVQSQRGAASQTGFRASRFPQSRSAAVPRVGQEVSPMLMLNSQQVEAQWQAQQLQKTKPAFPQQHTQHYSPPRPRSTVCTSAELAPNHLKQIVTTEAHPTVATPAHSVTAARTMTFTQSFSGSGSTTIAALASFVSTQRAAAATTSAKTSTTGTPQPSNVAFAHRGNDRTPPAAPSPPKAALPRYTAISTSTDAAPRRSSFSVPTSGAASVVIPAPAHGSVHTGTPKKRLEAPLPRSWEGPASSSEHRGAAVPKTHLTQGSAAAPVASVDSTSPATHTRVMPPVPRSQQKQAVEQAQQLRLEHEAQLAQQRKQLQQVTYQRQQQQPSMYAVNTSRVAVNSTPPREAVAAPAQLPLGYTLAYAVPASTPTASAATRVLVSEPMPASRPTYTLLSCPSQTPLQGFQTAKGAVLCMVPAQALPQATACSEGEAPRLILVKGDGIFTFLQTATFSGGAVSGR